MKEAGRQWMPSSCSDNLRLRATVLREIREFFWERGVMEVDTPALSAAAAVDPNIDSLPVTAAGATYYLHTSPEFPMKRLLAAGAGDIYQLCHVFRDGEVGARHNPEFMMLEWYRLDTDTYSMMNEVETLIASLSEGRRRIGPALRVSYRQLISEYTGLDPFDAETEHLAAGLAAAGVDVPPGLDRDGLLDLMMATVVEPLLDPHRPVFVFDYPASQAALARVRCGEPAVAERFELFLGGMELANGFHELTDADEQERRFGRDAGRRKAEGKPALPVDRRLLEALSAGMPDCSGVALGVDRLIMYLSGARRISDVMAFDISRA